jgi:hypothetical protein
LCPSDNLLLGTTSDRPFFKCDALETDWLAEDAVSGEPVSAGVVPAICDLQGDFQIMQGEPILTPANLIMLSIY